MEDFLRSMKEQYKEHKCWLEWCKKLELVTGNNINNPVNKKLVALIEKWGYSLMELRNYQKSIGKGEYSTYEKGNLFGKFLK